MRPGDCPSIAKIKLRGSWATSSNSIKSLYRIPASLLRLLRIHQDERDAAGLLAAVHPRMVRRLLHDDVAGLEVHFAIVEQHIDLAGDDDRVIQRARAMHHRMARRQAFLRRSGLPYHLLQG